MKIYPAIDLLDGKCVRLRQGEFNASTTYSDDPVATARAFEAAGAKYLHLVDLSGAKNPGARQIALIGKIIEATSLRVQVGGGLRTIADAADLLALGSDRVVYGSAVVADPALGERLFSEFGRDRVTLALDVRIGADGVARAAAQGWQTDTAVTAQELLGKLAPVGLSRVLCTDISRDGMMSGPNLSLYQELISSFPSVELQASGGVSSLADLLRLKEAGAGSAIVGKALYEGAVDLRKAVEEC